MSYYINEDGKLKDDLVVVDPPNYIDYDKDFFRAANESLKDMPYFEKFLQDLANRNAQ